jgi:hypothetical protein
MDGFYLGCNSSASQASISWGRQSETASQTEANIQKRKPFLVKKFMTTTPAGNIQEQIEEELDSARTVCDVKGATSGECAAAWDAVEELQAEASHQKQVKPKNSFEKYCDDNPDAAECRIYDE